jgi:hypothetical protein
MLRSLDELTGYALLATDGEIGRAKDFLFDDRAWVVRYLVADTGKWLPRRKVLISPVYLNEPDASDHRLPVDLTRSTIEASPALDEHAPVSRRKELEFYSYYQIPPYWIGPRAWGVYSTLDALRAANVTDENATGREGSPPADSEEHLRSVNEVEGYHIAASDDDVGHVEDFIVDTSDWAIRWLVVDTRNWLPGRKVLLAPSWAESVSWDDRKLVVSLTTEQIENSPKFDPSMPINSDDEAKLYDYYGRPQDPN